MFMDDAKAFVSSGRRLAGGLGIDICSEAKKDASNKLSATKDRVKELGQEDLISSLEAELRSSYPDYFQSCVLGQERLLQEDAQHQQPSYMSQTEGQSPSRRMQNLVQCTLQQHQATGLKVAFSNTLEKDTCALQSPQVTNAKMREQCDAFCGANTVSLLIGSETFGFPMSASENICLPPSGVLKHDPTHLQQCSSWSLAFRQIEEAAATFIENVYVFNATRIEFFSATQLAVEAIQSYVASEEYTNQLQRVGNKVEFVINAVQSRLNDYITITIIFITIVLSVLPLLLSCLLLPLFFLSQLLLEYSYYFYCHYSYCYYYYYVYYYYCYCPEQAEFRRPSACSVKASN